MVGGGSSSANIFVRASYASNVSNFSTLQIGILFQGPWSNFEIGGGGGGTISDSILGGHKTLFLSNSL